jgi:polysaccharide export outer membrane protein
MLKPITLVFFVALLAGLQIPAHAAQDASLSASGDAAYLLGAKDGLKIAVWGHPELSGEVTIASDGTVSLPLIGSVRAAERTVLDLQNELLARLSDGYLKNPRVTVEVQRYVSQRVFVVGEVRTPGALPLAGPMTLLEVLARAGSLTEDAGGELVVLRGRDETAIGPLAAGQPNAQELARVSIQELRRGNVTNVPLRNGDTVFVPRAENIFVLGLVNNPGAYRLETGLTVMRALSLAGGTTQLGSTGRLRITRVVSGKPVERKASLDDVLQPGDTVTVGARRF